jgi:hypothetical protein
MSSNKPDFDTILNYVHNYVNSNPRDYTYIGIGSFPHIPIDKLTNSNDQIIPKFLVDVINNTDQTIRIIHIDPQLKNDPEKIKQYFSFARWETSSPLEFHFNDNDGFHMWLTTDFRIEVIFLADSFYHTNNYNPKSNDWFLEKMINTTLKYDSHMVVQEYTGNELIHIFKNFYEKASNKELFKKKILFDVSYNNDCSCMTDLNKYEPFYDDFLDFHNFLLYDESDMLKIIGINPKLDNVVKVYFLKKYKKILNDIHVDYRRRVKGDGHLFGHSKYNDKTSPDEIMSILQSELSEIIKIFDCLKIVTPEIHEKIKTLFEKYVEYDVYDWNKQVNNLF